MFCNNCGQSLPATAKFCGACGAKARAESAAQSSYRETNNNHSQNIPSGTPDTDAAKYIYILFFLGYLTGGLTALVGAVWAYQKRKQASAVNKSHFQYQISTFWKKNLIGLGFVALVAIQLFVQMKSAPFNIIVASTGLGVLLTGILAIIYLGIRTFKGFQLLDREIINSNCWWLPASR